jgi:hypothetical protein
VTFEELVVAIQEQRQKARIAEEQAVRERAKLRSLIELLREKTSD